MKNILFFISLLLTYMGGAQNVGIGTTNPGAKLEVLGKTMTSDFMMTNGAFINYLLQSDGSGNASWVDPTSVTTSTDLDWGINGNEIYNLNSGNVGVGTTSPKALFNVLSTSNTNIASVLVNADSFVMGTSMAGYGFSLHPTNKAKAAIFFKSSQAGVDWGRGDLIFALDTASDWLEVSEAEEVMRLTYEGNLGIGTSTPLVQLHTTGGVRFEGLNMASESLGLMSDANGDLSTRILNSVAFNGEVDGDINNEIQTLTLNANDLSISSGNTVSLSGVNTDAQTLSFNNPMISISGGNSIDISALDTDDQNLAEVLAQGNNGNNLEMVNINGIRVGSASSPGSWGVYVNGISYVSDYFRADGGIHVGGSSDPGTDNLIVDGNVGIGTTGPSQMLDVNGNTRLRAKLYDVTNSAGSAGQVLTTTGTGIDWVDPTTITTASQIHAIDDLTDGSDGLGTNNVFLGEFSGTSNVSGGNNNVGLGIYSLNALTSGNENVANGYKSLYTNTTGGYNVAIGSYSMEKATTGNDYNISIGRMSMRGTSSYSGTDYNTSIGYYSLYSVRTNADFNTALGYRALYGNTTGTHNTSVGSYSGDNITTGIRNIMIGYNSDAPSATSSYQLNIGNIIYGTTINGSGSTLSTGNIGIGTTSPGQKLHIYGGDLLVEEDATLGGGADIRAIDKNGNQIDMYSQNGSGNLKATTSGMDLEFGAGGWTTQMIIKSGGNVGIGLTSPSYHLHVSGRIKTDGITESSDLRLKQKINDLENSLEIINQLRGVSYYWKKDVINKKGLKKSKQIGLIAQEVEKILPEVVDTDNDGYKSIQYSHVVPLLIEAIKELSSDNSSLRSELEAQKTRLTEIDEIFKSYKREQESTSDK